MMEGEGYGVMEGVGVVIGSYGCNVLVFIKIRRAKSE